MRAIAKVFVLAGTAAVLLLLNWPAVSQSVCMARAEVEKQLGTNHAESPVALGLANNGSVFEVFATADGAAWTMIITLPNGTSCLFAEGEAWETVPRSKHAAEGVVH